MSYITNRYQQDPNFQHKQKFYITNRYSQDNGFKQRQRFAGHLHRTASSSHIASEVILNVVTGFMNSDPKKPLVLSFMAGLAQGRICQ
ncbi:hypothetical protein CRUP_030894 [Coryphaenoides rupestris]|nr:hypothetical protein CRUP_030894 [Coryphaenoides rupestris]